MCCSTKEVIWTHRGAVLEEAVLQERGWGQSEGVGQSWALKPHRPGPGEMGGAEGGAPTRRRHLPDVG